MQELSKSSIGQKFTSALKELEDKEFVCMLKPDMLVVRFSLTFEERESYVDANGVKWVRES